MIDLAEPEPRPRYVTPDVDGRVEPPWPASMAFLTAWWMPATTARRTQHVSLARAFGVHVLAAAAGCFLFFLLAAWMMASPGSGRTFDIALGRLLDDLIGEFAREFGRWPLGTIGVLIGIVLLIEAGFVVLALLLSPWGAADERMRTSIANGLRQTWLHTVDVLPAFLVVGCIAVPLSHASQEWRNANLITNMQSLDPPTMPTPPGAVPVDSPEWQAYQKQMQDYRAQMNEYHSKSIQQWRDWRDRQPWYVRYSEPIFALASFGAGVWILWALLAAVGARRRVPSIARPPLCEACGYNLTTMPMEARCPECGEPVVDSLGPAARPGTPWERRRELGRFRAWLSTCLAAIFRPAWLGRQIRVSSRVIDHRLFVAICLVPSFLAGYCVALGIDYVESHPQRNTYSNSTEVVCFVGPISGTVSASLALFGALAAAGLFGLWVGLVHRRNLVPAAMQLAGYLMALLAFCGLVSAGLAVAMVKVMHERWFQVLEQVCHIDQDFLAFLGWAVPTAVMVLICLVLLYRATQAARFANR